MNNRIQIVKDMLFTAFHKVNTVSAKETSFKIEGFLRESSVEVARFDSHAAN